MLGTNVLRAHLLDKKLVTDQFFRWRGGEVSRLEGLSDGVFGLTLTLLVISQSVPTTFFELWKVIRDLPVFLFCFGLLMTAWQYHYLFFRRYGLEDFSTSILNAVFLFLILLYAYPLKFLATFLWMLALGDDTAILFELPEGVVWMQESSQRAGMLYFFGAGVAGVFGVMGLMSFRAFQLRSKLELDSLELFLTRAWMRRHGGTALVAGISICILLLGFKPGWAGVVFIFLLPAWSIDVVYTYIRVRVIHDGVTSREAVKEDAASN